MRLQDNCPLDLYPCWWFILPSLAGLRRKDTFRKSGAEIEAPHLLRQPLPFARERLDTSHLHHTCLQATLKISKGHFAHALCTLRNDGFHMPHWVQDEYSFSIDLVFDCNHLVTSSPACWYTYRYLLLGMSILTAVPWTTMRK